MIITDSRKGKFAELVTLYICTYFDMKMEIEFLKEKV